MPATTSLLPRLSPPLSRVLTVSTPLAVVSALATPAAAQRIANMARAWGFIGGPCQVCYFQPFGTASLCPTVGGVARIDMGGGAIGTSEVSAVIGGPLRARSTITVSNSTVESHRLFSRAGFDDVRAVRDGAAPAFVRCTVDISGSLTAGPRCTLVSWSGETCPYGIVVGQSCFSREPMVSRPTTCRCSW